MTSNAATAITHIEVSHKRSLSLAVGASALCMAISGRVPSTPSVRHSDTTITYWSRVPADRKDTRHSRSTRMLYMVLCRLSSGHSSSLRTRSRPDRSSRSSAIRRPVAADYDEYRESDNASIGSCMALTAARPLSPAPGRFALVDPRRIVTAAEMDKMTPQERRQRGRRTRGPFPGRAAGDA